MRYGRVMTSPVSSHTYVVALGSNRAGRFGRSPSAMLEAAIDRLLRSGQVRLKARSSIRATAPLGPARRRFANGAILIETALRPDALLRLLKAEERAFGRRPGRRWADRPLDLDIILWSGGRHYGPGLIIPHVAYHMRDFVLDPLCAIAPAWRDPRTGYRMTHLRARWRRRGNNG